MEVIAGWIIHVISTAGYPGIFLLMGIESALIPLPSEIIMPFSGYLASLGRFDLFWVALVGGLGNLAGSLISYYLGYWGHERVVRRFVRKFGKYLLFTEVELDQSERWMHKYKMAAVFMARLIPGVRTVISLAAGIVKLPIYSFIILTFLGSFIWSFILAFIGFSLGRNWQSIGGVFHKFEDVIIILIVLGIGVYIYRRLREVRA